MMNRRVPVNVDQEIDLRIEAVGEKGDGIAKVDGFVLFVPGVKEGDNVRVKVTKVLPKVGFAEVIGSASAPAEESSNDAPAQEDEQEAAAAEQQEEPAQENPQDSEDFGEEEQPADDAGIQSTADEQSEEPAQEEQPAESEEQKTE